MDLRSLAVYRIGIAFFTFGDLLLRISDLKAHYTDWGVLPRSALLAEPFFNPWRFSVHFMSGEVWAQTMLFLITAVFAFMLLVGFHTRLASFFVWFLTISVQARNPMILQGGDVFYRMALFFGMFLPLNGCCSVDRALDASREAKPIRIISAGTVGFILQIIFVYDFSVAIKLGRSMSRYIWWDQGMAVYNALSVDQFTRLFGYFLLKLPIGVLKFLNYYALGVELFAPLLLLLPFKNSIARIVMILLIGGLHVGLGTALSLGPFPFIGTITLLPLIPSNVWSSIKSKLFPRKKVRESTALRIMSLFCYQKLEFLRLFAEKWIRLFPAKPLKLGLPLPAQIIAAFSIAYIFFWNLGSIGLPYGIPFKFLGIGQTLQFDQAWNMFSPPLTDDGWYVIPGRLRSGKEVDVFREGRPIDWVKPKRVSWLYKNERWRKYMMNIWMGANQGYRLYYGQYLCRNWNATHPPEEALEEFEIFYMREDTVLYQNPVPKKVSTWRHYCFQVPDPLPPSKWDH